jgi:hypothetical protein
MNDFLKFLLHFFSVERQATVACLLLLDFVTWRREKSDYNFVWRISCFDFQLLANCHIHLVMHGTRLFCPKLVQTAKHFFPTTKRLIFELLNKAINFKSEPAIWITML